MIDDENPEWTDEDFVKGIWRKDLTLEQALRLWIATLPPIPDAPYISLIDGKRYDPEQASKEKGD